MTKTEGRKLLLLIFNFDLDIEVWEVSNWIVCFKTASKPERFFNFYFENEKVYLVSEIGKGKIYLGEFQKFNKDTKIFKQEKDFYKILFNELVKF